MTTLRALVVFVKSLVILTIAMAGAGVADSLFSETWHGVVVLMSKAN